MWLEKQPFGAPDGDGKVSEGKGSHKGLDQKHELFARKRNRVLSAQRQVYYVLEDRACHWSNRCRQWYQHVSDDEVRWIDNALNFVWYGVSDGTLEMPKIGMTSPNQFEDAKEVLQKIASGLSDLDTFVLAPEKSPGRQRLVFSTNFKPDV